MNPVYNVGCPYATPVRSATLTGTTVVGTYFRNPTIVVNADALLRGDSNVMQSLCGTSFCAAGNGGNEACNYGCLCFVRSLA